MLGKRRNSNFKNNKTIGEIIVILNASINELTNCFPLNNSLVILDVVEGKIYDNNEELIETNIKNGSVLALI